jgi:hypothetical protein
MHAHTHTHTHTHTHRDKYVILIAFSRLLLRERASVLRYTRIACFIKTDLSVLEFIYIGTDTQRHTDIAKNVCIIVQLFFFSEAQMKAVIRIHIVISQCKSTIGNCVWMSVAWNVSDMYALSQQLLLSLRVLISLMTSEPVCSFLCSSDMNVKTM